MPTFLSILFCPRRKSISNEVYKDSIMFTFKQICDLFRTSGFKEVNIYLILGFSCEVTAAMLAYTTTGKKFFWELYSIILQNLSDILPLFIAVLSREFNLQVL